MVWVKQRDCMRCGKHRAKVEYEGLPICQSCEAEIRESDEPKRKCPQDGRVMRHEVLLNVVIDRCPKCDGVWLDGGELGLIKKAVRQDGDKKFTSGFLLGMAM